MATVISPVRVDIVTTARQIVEARSVDEIVSATLHAARELLQTDVAFLTELREGTLRLRASLGLHHPTSFADYAVPIGKGISGRVAATNRPLTVRDYRHDPRRVAPLSPSLDAEGLISAVMAPFRRDDGRVSGVLNTATRSPRAFSDEEADLLTALAGLASLVLARAEESDALNANLARLNAASQTYNSELRAQEAMIEALLAGEDADVAVQAAGARLGVTFLLQHGGDSVAGARSVITAAVAGGSWQLSAIDVSGNVSQRTVARLADVLALQLARERALLDVELRLGQQLVDALLVADEESLHTLERRAARLGIDLSAPRAVVCIKTPEPVDRRLLDRLARITASMSPESLLTAHDDMAVVLWALPADDDAPSAQLEISALLDRLSMPEATAGIGSVCSRAADFGDSLREAVFALETAAHASRRRRIATAQQLGMYRATSDNRAGTGASPENR